MTSFYELECMLYKFVESKGFKLHYSTFTAYGSEARTYQYKLVISKNSEFEAKDE